MTPDFFNLSFYKGRAGMHICWGRTAEGTTLYKTQTHTTMWKCFRSQRETSGHLSHVRYECLHTPDFHLTDLALVT